MGFSRDANVTYIIDFSLSKEFRDPHTRLHIPFGKTLGLTGTPTFASINSHLGLELGRWDDLESLAYVLIYFLCSSLPWQGWDFKGHDHVIKSKQQISTHELCKVLPQEFHTFLNYSRLLSFNDKPNYDYLWDLFDNLLLHVELETDITFDWEGLNGVADEQLGAKQELLSNELKHTPKWHTGRVFKIANWMFANRFIQIAFSGHSTACCCEMKLPFLIPWHSHPPSVWTPRWYCRCTILITHVALWLL